MGGLIRKTSSSKLWCWCCLTAVTLLWFTSVVLTLAAFPFIIIYHSRFCVWLVYLPRVCVGSLEVRVLPCCVLHKLARVPKPPTMSREKKERICFIFLICHIIFRGRFMCILLPPTPFHISTAHRNIWFKTHICIYAITKKGTSRFTDKVLPILTMFTFFYTNCHWWIIFSILGLKEILYWRMKSGFGF